MNVTINVTVAVMSMQCTVAVHVRVPAFSVISLLSNVSLDGREGLAYRHYLSRFAASVSVMASNYMLLQTICLWQAIALWFPSPTSVLAFPNYCYPVTLSTPKDIKFIVNTTPEPVSYRLVVRLPRLATLCNAPKSNGLLRQNLPRNGLPKAKGSGPHQQNETCSQGKPKNPTNLTNPKNPKNPNEPLKRQNPTSPQRAKRISPQRANELCSQGTVISEPNAALRNVSLIPGLLQ